MSDETYQSSVPEQQAPQLPALPQYGIAPLLLMPGPRRASFRGRRSAFFRWFTVSENITVCLIAAVILVVHLLNIANPPSWNTSVSPPTRNTIADEVYYVGEASNTLHGQPFERPEHPPLAKWLIAGGMFVFGDNAVGWRSLPILFGMVSIFLFYFICRRLAREQAGSASNFEISPQSNRHAKWFRVSTFVPVLATFLFATDNLSFAMGHVAMLEVFYVTFMLLGFLLYLRGNYLACGAVMGLGMLCKAMAFLPVLAILLHWLVTRRTRIMAELRCTLNALRGRKREPSTRSEILGMTKLAVVVPAVWLLGLILLEYPVSHHLANPFSRTMDMIHTMLSINDAAYGSTTGIASVPWAWLISPAGMALHYAPRYVASTGWTVWALIVPSIGYTLFEVVRGRGRGRGHNVAMFVLAWFAGTYGLLILTKVVTHRLMYSYYFYPSVAAVCLAIAWGTWKLWSVARGGSKTKIIFLAGISVYLLGTIATFIMMSPYCENLLNLPTN